MPGDVFEYCDVSLPVPIDQAFTYRLPLTLRHRVKPGCRVLVPFGARRLTGVVLTCHETPPEVEAREALRLLDEEPVLDESLLGLARWLASYYCAPLGEVLRCMTPLGGEIRRSKVYTLTDTGRDAARRLTGDAVEPSVQLLRMLEARPLSEVWLNKQVPGAGKVLKNLQRKGFVQLEEVHADRDPLRASSSRLKVEFSGRPAEAPRKKSERELLAYLEMHPGPHSLAAVEKNVRGAGQAARALARRSLVLLRPDEPASPSLAAPARHTLNPAQQEAFERLKEGIDSRQFHTFLLQGVTGSGKTEVYLNAIQACLDTGRGALLLVPEIALTPAVAGQFYHRFPDRVAVLHSAFGDAERAEQWRRIRTGAASVVVGTRSAVFAPVRDLGLVLVDEEHDQSYKQEETPRYGGRDVAVVRGQHAGACVVLGSATPSLESRQNVERGRYTLLELPDRIERRPMPQVEIIDMREEFLATRKQAVFSRSLLEAIRERLSGGEQTMLLLNRRGFSSFVSCRSCGESVQCRDCSVTLTYHRRDRRLLCHYCNYAERVPTVCPQCASEYIYFVGLGSEKVEDELHQAFPTARIARMDRDTVTGKRRYETILQSFRNGEYDILVGTQMIAKGHDIPNVTLVGIVSADIGLSMPDFRAAERTFQLLTQAAGRAGRGSLPGQVLIQTSNPDHYAIRFAAAQDYASFYAKELEFRRAMRYPPFSALANVVIRARTQEEAFRLSGELSALVAPPPAQVRVLGPAEAPLQRLKGDFRYQMLIKSSSRVTLREVLNRLRSHALEKRWPATALIIDVDPFSLM